MMLSIQITEKNSTPSERYFTKIQYSPKITRHTALLSCTCAYVESSSTGVEASTRISTKTVITGRDLLTEVILLRHTILSLSLIPQQNDQLTLVSSNNKICRKQKIYVLHLHLNITQHALCIHVYYVYAYTCICTIYMYNYVHYYNLVKFLAMHVMYQKMCMHN